ncbi:MAG: cell shape determination protein CcmA [Spirosoma sp.]|nr:cell shape determination protein CcmA [Spirosoma sp.]
MKSRWLLSVLLLQLLAIWGCRIQNNPPELTGLTPGKAFVGQEINLTGYQFGLDPTVMVGVGATAQSATILAKDDHSIRAVVPPVAPGYTQIRVRNDQGTSDPLPMEVQQPPPALTDITPGNGLPGTAVVLTGSYLNQLRQVKFRDALFKETVAVTRDSSAQKLTVIVPNNLPHGPMTILVETAGGMLTGSFIVAGTPQISQISPKVTRPGAEIIIQGVNLLDAIVRINDQHMDRAKTIVKDTEIRTIIPEFAKSGRVTVTVFEKLIATSADTVQVVQPPFITKLGVSDGFASEILRLTGQNLRDVTTVSFGTTPAQFRILSDTEIDATVPKLPAPGIVFVSVNSAGGTHTSTDRFFYFQIPTDIIVSPTRQIRGRAITISGQNLHRITDVRINGQSVPITDRVEGSQLFVNVAADGTSGPITVVNRAGSATSTLPLVVVQKPLLTDMMPAKGKPGDRVTLRGDFLLNAQIFFSGTNVTPAEGGKNEDTERWVLVPNGAQTGPLRIVNAAGETITSPFTVVRLITLTSFAPIAAKVGDTILLTGQNLSTAQDVRFGNGSSGVAKFTADENGQLLVTVPIGAITGPICVTNEAGTNCSTTSFTVTK